MLITGSFKNIKNDSNIELFIYRDNNDSTVYEISDVKLDNLHNFCFNVDPIRIEKSFSDFTKPIITTSCTISLITNIWAGDLLYATDYSDIICAIYKDNELIFIGYVEPRTYNQDVNMKNNEIDIHAVDILTVLSEYSYADYVAKVKNTQISSFKDIILNMLGRSFTFEDKFGNSTTLDINIYVDDNIRSLINEISSNMVNLKVAEDAFLGDSEDDAMHYDEILTALLRYMNARIVSIDGQKIYILSNNITSNYNTFLNINNDTVYTFSNISNDINNSNIANEQVSMDDVYNQIGVTCKISNIDNVIESPLDKDSLNSPYTNKQFFMREYSGSYEHGQREGYYGFCRLVVYDNFDRVPIDEVFYRDWYMRYMENPNWKLNNNFYTPYTPSPLHPVYYEDGGYVNQYRTMFDLGYGTQVVDTNKNGLARRDGIGGPYFMAIGKSEEINRKNFYSYQGYIGTDNFLIIPVKGLWRLPADENTAFSEYETMLQNYVNDPMATYTSSVAMNLSPTDASTTNYIIFSGKLRYNPVWQGYGDDFDPSHPDGDDRKAGLAYNYYKNRSTWHEVVHSCQEDLEEPEVFDPPCIYNGKERIYYQRYVMKKYPSQKTWVDIDQSSLPLMTAKELVYNFVPPIENSSLELFKYGSTKIIDNNAVLIDRVYKVPVLCCRLQIGNKFLKEIMDDATGLSTYEWTTDNTALFTLGIDPNIDDPIINKDWELSNNISDDMNIDTKGTAIPISFNDNLNGIVKFEIIGPYNSSWNEATGTVQSYFSDFFESPQEYESHNRSILNRVSNIFISDFKCEIYSDNAKNATVNENNDLEYLSENLTEFKNDNTGISFDIYTAITSDEAFTLGLANGISKSNVMDVNNNIYTTTYANRPEVKYVQNLFDLYSTPKKIVNFEVDYVTDDQISNKIDELYRKKVNTEILDHLNINPYYSIVTNTELSLYKNRINITLREI